MANKHYELILNVEEDEDDESISVVDFTIPTDLIEAGKTRLLGQLLCQVAVDLVEGRVTFNEEN